MTTHTLSRWMPALLIAVAPIAIHGSTLYTYSFTQTGYAVASIALTGTLTGTFSGIAEPGGIIQLLGNNADGLVFSSTFEIFGSPVNTFVTSTSLPAFFSFDINGGSSTLDFAQVNTGGMLCVGAVALFGGFGCNGGLFPGTYKTAVTSNLPVVTLVSAVPLLPPTPVSPASAVPEPGALFLTGTGLIGVGLWRHRAAVSSKPLASGFHAPLRLR